MAFLGIISGIINYLVFALKAVALILFILVCIKYLRS